MAAARAKGKVAIVERSNELLRSVLDDGIAKGDIADKRSFMMYLGFGMQKRNSIRKPGRRAFIELWCGPMVGTVRQMALAGGDGVGADRIHVKVEDTG